MVDGPHLVYPRVLLQHDVGSCVFDLDHAIMIHPSRCHLHVFFNAFYKFYHLVSSNVAMENHPSIVDLHLRTSIYSR